MSDNKMTIHRGLSELKLIDSRIDKGIAQIEPSGVMQKGKNVGGIYDKESFEKNAKSKFASVLGLIDRKGKIKSAIVQANSTTKITVGGKVMTIADAINYKTFVGAKRVLADTILLKHKSQEGAMNTNNEKVKAHALQLAQAALQKPDVKIDDEQAIVITKPYVEANEFLLVDPLNAIETAEKMIEEVENFEMEIDATLSEINATTFIEID